MNRGPRGVPDAPSTGGKKLSKKLGKGGSSTQGPSVFRARAGARQLSVGATPRIARPGAQGRDVILCPQPAGRIAASAGSSVDAPAPRSPKVSWWVQQTRERAAAAASSPRPHDGAPRAHPRRPLLGDRGRQARQGRARCLPTLGWRVASPPPPSSTIHYKLKHNQF